MKQVLGEIITIGDEILIGQILDTNSTWMAEKLNNLGIKVHRISSISDTKEAIFSAIDTSFKEVDLILMTGGLGPTKDDITKQALTDYFNTELVLHEPTLKTVKSFFEARKMNFNEMNHLQAMLPKDCTVLRNDLGTAQGMLFEKGEKVLISMPGVPYEMKGLMENEIVPRLPDYFELSAIFHKTIRTVGIPESELAEIMGDWANALPPHIKLAYLPSYGQVRLRMSAYGDHIEQLRSEVNDQQQKLEPLIEKYIFGYDRTTLEEAVGAMLAEKNISISTAESCTGGYISNALVAVPGSSAYYQGSIVAYHNDIKKEFLEVSEEILREHGAVSEQVVAKMAESIREKFGTDLGVATSGIAGPGGGTPEKPVGTVWVALSDGKITKTKLLSLFRNRDTNIKRTTIYVLDMIRKHVNG